MSCIDCGEKLEIVRAPMFSEIPYVKYICHNCNMEWTADKHIDELSYLIEKLNAQEERIKALELLIIGEEPT